MINAKGYTTLSLPSGDFDLELSFSEVADIDAHLKARGQQPFLEVFSRGVIDFDLIRTVYFYGSRGRCKKIEQVAPLLKGASIGQLVTGMSEALRASGVFNEEDAEEESEGEK